MRVMNQGFPGFHQPLITNHCFKGFHESQDMKHESRTLPPSSQPCVPSAAAPAASALPPLRRKKNEPMPRKENVLDGANRATFHIALTCFLDGLRFFRHV